MTNQPTLPAADGINRWIRSRLGTPAGTSHSGQPASSRTINDLIRKASGRAVAEPEPQMDPTPDAATDGDRDGPPVAFADLGGGPRGTPFREPRQADYNRLIRAGTRQARARGGAIDLNDIDPFYL